MKVLVVDDNPDDRMLLRLVVERQGHEAIEAENGQQGFELAAAAHPDLIISDALMPVLDGFNFLKKLKEDVVLKAIPFIFYSATYKADRDLALAASLGAVAYILKPKEPVELWAEIKAALEKGGTLRTVASGVTDVEYLKKYSAMVATKLEEKVVELEKALADREKSEKALAQAKEEWERSFEAINDIALILTPDLRVIRANRQAKETLAAGAGGELLGKYCYEAFQEGGGPCVNCPVLFASGDAVGQACEVEYKGMGKIFQVTASPVLDAEGRVMSIVHFAKDITAQKELEHRLNQAQKLEAIGTLAGGIAHDFNNILTPILGYAELAKMALGPSSPAGESLMEIIKAGLRAKDLVQQILTFSRQKEHERLPLEPHIIVKEAIKLLRSSIPTSIEIRQQVDAHCGRVLADATKLHQIVMNLCTNAYHAMRETGGVLAVSLLTEQVEAGDSKVNGFQLLPGNYVVLEVSDTGCGMDRKTMAKIFDPYFTTKKIGEGTGLGLSVVHGIVKDYGGHISVYSEEGKGSTFRVYLPRLIAAAQEEEKIGPQPLPHGTERILLVDDEQTIVDLETTVLQSLGYQVTGLTNSLEALRRFQETPAAFDLILTDMTMPGLNGTELSLRSRSIRSDIPIILCSGFSELIDGEKAKSLGIQEFIMKPVLTRELADTIRKVLDRKENG